MKLQEDPSYLVSVSLPEPTVATHASPLLATLTYKTRGKRKGIVCAAQKATVSRYSIGCDAIL